MCGHFFQKLQKIGFLSKKPNILLDKLKWEGRSEDGRGGTGTGPILSPHQYSDGIDHVLIQGRIVIEDGEFNGTLAGKPLRFRTHDSKT